jgi:heme/copper-type cytochrome/quinol oxidase subunit 2
VAQVRVRAWIGWTAGLTAVVAVVALSARGASARIPARFDVQVAAKKYAYRIAGADRPEIHVHEGDVVHVTFSTDDIPHSFTIDEPYRISRRAVPGKPVTFEFLADKAGTFPFYCNLVLDERCRKEVRGTLIVDPRDR